MVSPMKNHCLPAIAGSSCASSATRCPARSDSGPAGRLRCTWTSQKQQHSGAGVGYNGLIMV